MKNQTKDVQVMRVIYSMMQGECTTLPDTIVFMSKNEQTKQTGSKTNKKVWPNCLDRGAISCETPSPSHLKISQFRTFPSCSRGHWYGDDTSLENEAEYVQKMNQWESNTTRTKAWFPVVSVRSLFRCRHVVCAVNRTQRRVKATETITSVCTYWHKPSVSKISIYIIVTVHVWVSLEDEEIIPS